MAGDGGVLSLPRFFAEGPLVGGATVPLPEDERRHARARRLSEGDRVLVLDGRGVCGEGVLTAEAASVALSVVHTGVGEPRCSVTLLLSVAEPARVEWAVEKGTECGAAAFLLVAAERSQATHVRALRARHERLSRIAREAVKQCGRSVVPEVEGPISLAEAIGRAPRPLFVASPGAAPLPAAVTGTSSSVAIGPEGGFAPTEEKALLEAGAVAFSLGPRILRLETATVAVLARLAVD